MSKRENFLHAILENPADDDVRLVFSDWLEEHDDLPRAELIRAQCKLAKLSPHEREYQELTWVVEALLAQHRAAWVAELPVLSGITWGDFERGFVSTVRATNLTDLYAQDQTIAQTAPVYRVEFTGFDEGTTPRPEGSLTWLTALRIIGRNPCRSHEENSLLDWLEEIELVQMSEYFDVSWITNRGRLPTLQRIRVQGSHTAGQALATWIVHRPEIELTHLEIGTRFIDYDSGYFEDPTLGHNGATELARAKNLRNLEALNLNRQRIGPEGFRALVTSGHLETVRELEVRASQTEDISALESSTGKNLVRLDLSLTALREAGVRSLAKSRRCAHLERLDLDTCEINAKALAVLTKAPFWKTLRHLNLSRNPLGSAGAWALREASVPAKIHTLLLTACDLDEEAGKALGTIGWFKNLLVLDLSDNNLGSVGLAGLAGLAGGTLCQLNLSETGIDEVAAKTLAPLWPQLLSLDLSANPLTNDGLAAFLAAGNAPDLLDLNLSSSGVSAQGIKPFLKRPPCPKLRTLNLSGNQLTTGTIKEFVASSVLSHLRELTLSDCRLSTADAIALAESPALTGLRVLNLRNNELGETGLVALAESPHLRHTELRLSGNPWSFKEPARKMLERRLGQYWYYYEEEEQDNEEFDGDEYEDDFDEDEDT